MHEEDGRTEDEEDDRTEDRTRSDIRSYPRDKRILDVGNLVLALLVVEWKWDGLSGNVLFQAAAYVTKKYALQASLELATQELRRISGHEVAVYPDETYAKFSLPDMKVEGGLISSGATVVLAGTLSDHCRREGSELE